MRSNVIWIAVIAILLVIIVVMAWFLVTTPGPAVSAVSTSTPVTTTTTTTSASSSAPLSESVTVTTPASGASVERTFAISGVAPNGWYFEAVFPIQVRDGDDNLIATAQGQAQSDWTTPGPVRFSATITIPDNYSGPANLILLRDNPSGLPENFDEVTVPIIII